MFLIHLLRQSGRLRPGRMLDIGARDCAMARDFAAQGYTVDAIDPLPPPEAPLPAGVTYHRTTLNDFTHEQPYDLVVASMVSHLVGCDAAAFIGRLKALTTETGLIFVTLFGPEDGWASHERTHAVTLERACAIVAEQQLRPFYRSVEWFDADTYAGERKPWHIIRLCLERA